MRIYDYFELVLLPIKEGFKLLRSDAIADYLFNGTVNLAAVLVVFFVGTVLIRFLLSPVHGGGLLRRNRPQDPQITEREKADFLNSWDEERYG